MENNERLFDDHFHLTVEEVAQKVNELIQSDMSLMEKNDDMSKWINLPSVLVDSQNNKEKFVSFVAYVDELMIATSLKVDYINTVASLLINAKVEICTIDTNNLFLLVSYLEEEPSTDYEVLYALLGSEALLYHIRRNTLDIAKRRALLQYVVEQAKMKNVVLEDINHKNMFLEEMNTLFQEQTADEILGIDNYMNGATRKTVEFRDSISS